jgi:hypothetical protein
VLENVKTAQTDRAVTAVSQTCQSMFPEKVIPPLPKLSKGMKANLVCTYQNNDTFILTVDPKNKLYGYNADSGMRLGEITIITSDTIYGINKWVQGTEKLTYHFLLNTTTGRLGGRVERLNKDGKKMETVAIEQTTQKRSSPLLSRL